MTQEKLVADPDRYPIPKGVTKTTTKGTDYYRPYRGRGAPRIPFPPHTAEFNAFCQVHRPAADAYLSEPAERVGADTIAWLIGEMRASGKYKLLPADGAKRNYEWWLPRIKAEFGPLLVAEFNRPEMKRAILAWRDKYADTPRAADEAKKTLSRLLGFAAEFGLGGLTVNPCAGMENLAPQGGRAMIIWTDDDLERLQKVARTDVWFVAKLAYLTGMRKSDLLALEWRNVDAFAIEYMTRKSRKMVMAQVPMWDELRDHLATVKRGEPGDRVCLMHDSGDGWTGYWNAIWNVTKIKARCEHLHFHDLRGTCATKLYKGGFAVEEIAEMLGWKLKDVDKIIKHYVTRNSRLTDRIERARADAEMRKSGAAQLPAQLPAQLAHGGLRLVAVND